MNRWLLNTFTTWELGLVVIGGFVVIAVVGLLVFQRLVPEIRKGESNDVAGVILGVLAAIYGIVLAFVIVSLYEDYKKTSGDIRTEASALSTIYRDTRGLAPPVAAKIKLEVGDYISTVRNEEWRLLRDGKESDRAWRELQGFYTTLQAYEPKTTSQQAFYAEAIGRINDLVDARRERLNDAEEGIPPTFEVLLIGGALLVLGFTFLFGVSNARLHQAMVIAVAVLLGFNLLVALVLDFPFSGQVSVSSAPFVQGALSVFAGP